MWERLRGGKTEQKQGSSAWIGQPSLEILRDTDLAPDAPITATPLLVCHGTADTRIDIAHSRRLARRARRNPGFSLDDTQLEDASHPFKPQEVHCSNLAQRIINRGKSH